MSLTCACLCSQFKRNSIITPSQPGQCDGPQLVMQMISLEHPEFVDVGTCELQNLNTGVFLESDGDVAATHTAHNGAARRILHDSEIYVPRISEWDGQSR